MAERELIKVLLVEDNMHDITITKEALKEARLINEIYIVRDDQEALDFLRHQGGYAADPTKSPRPGLILLDINLPKMNGVEVLAHIKQDQDLRQIPIIMLTASRREEDVVKSYDNGCNSFLEKPVEFDVFVQLVKEIGLYWAMLNVPDSTG